MSYEKQNFVNNQNLTADHLNHIENGIKSVEQSITLENVVKYGNVTIIKEAEELASFLDAGSYYINGDLFFDAHRKNAVMKLTVEDTEYELSFEDADFHDATAEAGFLCQDYRFSIYDDKLSTIYISYIDAPEYDMSNMNIIGVSTADWEDGIVTRLELNKDDCLSKIQKGMIESVDYSTIVNKPITYTKLEDYTNLALTFVDYLRLHYKNLIDRRTEEINATPYENSQGRDNELELGSNNFLEYSTCNGLRTYNMERNGMENAKGIKFTITQDMVDNIQVGNVIFACMYNTVNFPTKIRLVSPNGNYIDDVIPFTRAHGQASESGAFVKYFNLDGEDSYTPYLQAGDYYILFAVTENDMDYDSAFIDLSNIIVYIDNYSSRTDKVYSMKDIDKLLERDNIDPYIPVGDYNPATKKYVDTIADNKSDKLTYTDSEKENGLTFHRDQMTLMMEQGTMATFNGNQIIELNITISYTINVEFNDGSIETFNGRPTLIPLPNNAGYGTAIQVAVQNGDTLEKMIALMDNVKYTAEGSVTYDTNSYAFGIMHEKAAQFKSFTLIGPSQLEVNNEFFNEYKFVTENEKNYWNNKANKEDLFYDNRKYEEIIYSFDGDLSNKETFSVGGGSTFVKISDIDRPLSKEDFNDYDIKMKEYTNGQLSDEQWMSDSLGKEQMASFIFDIEEVPGAFSIADYVIFVPTDVNVPGFPFSKGIWFMHVSMNSDSMFVSDLKLNKYISGELKQIDNKFINLEYKAAGKTFTLEDGTKIVAGMCAETFNNYNNNAVNNIATGAGSHAEGGSTIALGVCAHAEGTVTRAYGYASHAEGWQTIASSEYQHVQGRYNIEDKNSIYAHIVGNGAYQNGEEKRSNAHTLDWSGNAWFAGKVTANGTPSAANDLVTKQYVDALAINNAIMNIAHIEEIDALIEENNIHVLDYKYQRVEMFNNANIIFPEVDSFTEIHLFFDTTEDLVINLPNCRKKQLPEILANKSYELVAIYNMNFWLVEINVFE